jgi:hypothetical protein
MHLHAWKQVKLRNCFICLESSPWDTQDVEEKGATFTDITDRQTDRQVHGRHWIAIWQAQLTLSAELKKSCPLLSCTPIPFCSYEGSRFLATPQGHSTLWGKSRTPSGHSRRTTELGRVEWPQGWIPTTSVDFIRTSLFGFEIGVFLLLFCTPT